MTHDNSLNQNNELYKLQNILASVNFDYVFEKTLEQNWQYKNIESK